MASWWERHVLPRVIDVLLDSGQVHKRRELVCQGLEGRVLEIGFGSGLNLEHYPATVSGVHAVEPNDDAWHLAQRRLNRIPTPVVRSGLDGQRLEEEDGSFDHVLSTFTLCTIPHLGEALSEAHRVLRPGGEVHFLEHGLAPEAGVQRWQRRFEPVQRRLGGGCHLTREPVAALSAAGFEIVELDAGYLPGPGVTKPAGYLYRGRARRP